MQIGVRSLHVIYASFFVSETQNHSILYPLKRKWIALQKLRGGFFASLPFPIFHVLPLNRESLFYLVCVPGNFRAQEFEVWKKNIF